jgi:thiol:disulfide interchange protein DsbA
MRRILICMLAVALTGAASAASNTNWAQGINYFLLQPPHPTSPTSVAPGKIEVTEVFSYACPACNHFYPIADKLRAALPANAELTFIPAAFHPEEDWPMFQRAFYAAQALGIDRKTHDAMFDAIWKTGELAIEDPASGRLKVPQPTIQTAAEWYSKIAGVSVQTFVNTANSFGVDTKTRQAEEFMHKAQIDQTPTIIVNGKYRLTVGSACAGSTCTDPDQRTIDLVLYLVQQESAAAKSAAH